MKQITQLFLEGKSPTLTAASISENGWEISLTGIINFLKPINFKVTINMD